MEVSDLKRTVERNERRIEVLVDIRTCKLTLGEVMKMIGEYQATHPGREVWMDGDAYAIMSRPREVGA